MILANFCTQFTKKKKKSLHYDSGKFLYPVYENLYLSTTIFNAIVKNNEKNGN